MILQTIVYDESVTLDLVKICSSVTARLRRIKLLDLALTRCHKCAVVTARVRF